MIDAATIDVSNEAGKVVITFAGEDGSTTRIGVTAGQGHQLAIALSMKAFQATR